MKAIKKIDNYKRIRIPVEFQNHLGWKVNDEIEVKVVDNEIILTKVENVSDFNVDAQDSIEKESEEPLEFSNNGNKEDNQYKSDQDRETAGHGFSSDFLKNVQLQEFHQRIKHICNHQSDKNRFYKVIDRLQSAPHSRQVRQKYKQKYAAAQGKGIRRPWTFQYFSDRSPQPAHLCPPLLFVCQML